MNSPGPPADLSLSDAIRVVIRIGDLPTLGDELGDGLGGESEKAIWIIELSQEIIRIAGFLGSKIEILVMLCTAMDGAVLLWPQPIISEPIERIEFKQAIAGSEDQQVVVQPFKRLGSVMERYDLAIVVKRKSRERQLERAVMLRFLDVPGILLLDAHFADAELDPWDREDIAQL